MHYGLRHSRASRSRSQRGQAALLVVMLVGIAAALLVYGMIDTTSAALRRDQNTAAAFSEVKRALIGWSVQRDPLIHGANARPGELPCPDMNNDGFEDGTCAAGAIGRVPWRTLGIPKPKDAAGQTLWYAIAGPFRIFTVNGNPIHSDTKGNITVNQGEYNVVTEVYSVVSTITSEAVAVIFSPGGVVGAQDRSCPVQDCDNYVCPAPASSTPMCSPANYLETAAGVNNSTTNGPFISAPTSDKPLPGFNDKVMAITTSDLMPIVEQRVAREVRTILENYRIATAAQGYNGGAGIYPWPDCTDGISDVDFPNRGRIPWQTATPVNWNTGTPATPTLPNWFTNQGATSYNWAWVIYYSVGKNYLENFGASCSTDSRWGCEPG
jgi:hypothetical protein